jgi:hypothetical protein
MAAARARADSQKRQAELQVKISMLKQQQVAMEEARVARKAEVELELSKKLLEKEADLQV